MPTPRRRTARTLDTKGGANPADSAAANINTIVAQFKKNGTYPRVATLNPLYGDYTFPEDIHSMREAVHQAEDRFDQLPADVRSLCGNDWVNFLARFDDEEGQQTLIDAGLEISDTPIPNNSPPPTTPPKTPTENKSTPTDPPATDPPAPQDPSTTT